MESKFPLRVRTQPKMKRVWLNFKVASLGLPLLRWVSIPIAVYIAKWSQSHNFGLMHLFDLPQSIEFLLVFLLMDYGIYFWHMMNHHIPFLWRFHNIHHLDIDLDVSTSVRFHAGELLIGILVRGIMIILIGASPLMVLAYEVVFETANNFQHSNWKLPKKLESVLNAFIVTPRMHGIHHSIIKDETDSNFSVIFSFWDKIHKTFKIHIPQDAITIGVPYYRNPQEEKFSKLLLLPFKKQKLWKNGDGTIPERKI